MAKEEFWVEQFVDGVGQQGGRLYEVSHVGIGKNPGYAVYRGRQSSGESRKYPWYGTVCERKTSPSRARASGKNSS